MTMNLTTKQKVLIASAVTAMIAVTIFVLWYLLTHPVFTAGVRNISLIVVAITLVVLDVAMLILLIQVIKLLQFLLIELKPVLQSLQETSNTVRGTANFVSERVADPTIEVSSKAAGVKGSIRFVVASILGNRPTAAKQGFTDADAGQTTAWPNATPASSVEENTFYG